MARGGVDAATQQSVGSVLPPSSLAGDGGWSGALLAGTDAVERVGARLVERCGAQRIIVVAWMLTQMWGQMLMRM